MCSPNEVLSHQKFLDMGPILVKKLLEEGPISQKLQKKKNGKINHFLGRNTLRNESQFAKILKKTSNQLLFEGDKSLDTGRSFKLCAPHPVKKLFRKHDYLREAQIWPQFSSKSLKILQKSVLKPMFTMKIHSQASLSCYLLTSHQVLEIWAAHTPTRNRWVPTLGYPISF